MTPCVNIFLNLFLEGLFFMENKNKTSESRLKANKKYLSQFSDVKIRLKPDEHKAVQEHANQTSESVAAFIKRAINETMERDKNK